MKRFLAFKQLTISIINFIVIFNSRYIEVRDMIQIIPATSRFSVKNDWLESNFSFSFGEYYDESNIRFGPLRVFNDDTDPSWKGIWHSST